MINVNQNRLSQLLSDEIRAQRDKLLTGCDWAMTHDAPTDKSAWQLYRQKLRDLTDQTGFPHYVVWPTSPQ